MTALFLSAVRYMKAVNTLSIWLCLMAFFSVKPVCADSADSLEMRIQAAVDEGRIVDDLGAAFAANPSGEFVLLPKNRNFRFGILIHHIDIYPDKAVFSAGMAFRDGRSHQLVAFAADKVSFYYRQGLTGPVTLKLLNPVDLHLGSYVSLNFMPGNPGTSVTMGCKGVEQFTVAGRLSFHEDLIYPVKENLEPLPDSSLLIPFFMAAENWDDLVLQLSIPKFGITGLHDFVFQLEQIVIDLSESRNAAGMKAHVSDLNLGLTNAEEWEGVYLGFGDVVLPRYFTNGNLRTSVGVNTLYIDDRGITGEVFGKQVLSTEKGNIGGWAIGIDEVRISILRNGLESAGMIGRLGLPILPDTQFLGFRALIGANDVYHFSVNAGKGLTIPAFRVARVDLDPQSRAEVSIEQGKVGLMAELTGHFSIIQKGAASDADAGASLPGIYIQGLRISNQAPKLSVKYIGAGEQEQGRVNGFPVYVNNVRFNSSGESPGLVFNLGVNLKDKISGEAGMEILARLSRLNGRERVEFEKLRLNHVKIDAQYSTFRFSGLLAFIRRDSTYGEGFSGKVAFTAELPPGKISGGTMVMFGSVQTHRYWYFDADLAMSNGVPVGPGISINGFLGGAWNGMRALRSGESRPPSEWGLSGTGRTYVPDVTAGTGLRAGVFVQGTGKGTFQSSAVLEMQFFKGGGLDKLMLYGGADFMTAGMIPGAQDFRQRTAESCRFPSAQDYVTSYLPTGKVSAALMMQFDFKNRIYFGDLGLYVNNGIPGIRGTGNRGYAGKATLYFSPTDWYVWIGNTQSPVALEAGVGKLGRLTAGAYLMTGTRVLPPANLPAQVAQLTGLGSPENTRDDRSVREGGAFAFGGQMTVNAGAEYRSGPWRLYALGSGQAGFDVNMRRISQVYTCQSTGKVPGINGWYSDGRWYAALNIRLGGAYRQIKVDVANLSAAALFAGQGPDPYYGRADIRIRVKLAAAQLDAGMNFTLGEACELVRTGLAEEEFISLSVPVSGARDVSTLVQPRVQYAYPVNRAFRDAGGRELRYLADQPRIKVLNGPSGSWKQDTSGLGDTYFPVAPFPAEAQVEIYCRVVLQSRNTRNGQWETMMHSGKPVGEEKTFVFRTGRSVQEIPESNVAAAWPSAGQVNFYKSVSSKGLIRLKVPQPQLFSVTGTRVVARFTSPASDIFETEARYSGSDITFDLPAGLAFDRVYRLRLVRQASSIPLQSGMQSPSRSDRAGGSPTSSVMGSKASPVPAPVMIYSCYFRMATKGRPGEQWAGMLQDSAQVQRPEGRLTASFSHQASQYFEPAELLNDARIRPYVALQQSGWYSTVVAPAVYHIYQQLSRRERTFIRFSRDTSQTGLVPVKAINLTQNGLNDVRLEDVHLSGARFTFRNQTVVVTFGGIAHMRTDLEDIRRGLLTYLQADPAADLKRLSALIPQTSVSSSAAIPALPMAPSPALSASLAVMPVSVIPVAVIMPRPRPSGLVLPSAGLRNELIVRIQGLNFKDPDTGDLLELKADYRSPAANLGNISMWRMQWP